jgi:uncharacterized protein
MKPFLTILTTFLLAFSLNAASQDIPERPDPPRLVNDFAGVLQNGEAESLEQRLVAFNDSTSTQITVVTVKSLNGYDKADFAYRLAEKWGIGQKGKNNGLLILVKPKTSSGKGEAYIAIGYGLEDVITDALGKRIVENEMIPRFREGDYFDGLNDAATVVMDLSRGKYTADQYVKKTKSGPAGLIIPVLILIIMLVAIRSGRNRSHSIGKSLPWWMALWMLGSSGRGHGGSWGGFSGGSGFGGGGGGFGGFGGGSFGGGGAGGSW